MSDTVPLRGLVPFAAADLVARCARVIARVEASRAREHQRKLEEAAAVRRTEWRWDRVDVLPRRVSFLPSWDTVETEYGKPDEDGRGPTWSGRWWTDRAHDRCAEAYHELTAAAEAVSGDTIIWVNTHLAGELH